MMLQSVCARKETRGNQSRNKTIDMHAFNMMQSKKTINSKLFVINKKETSIDTNAGSIKTTKFAADQSNA